MKKKAWPWIGSQEAEMGGKSSREMDSQDRYSSFAIGESISPSNDPIKHEDGIQSPLNNEAKDRKSNSEIYIDISDDDNVLATFSCNVAKEMHEKIAGLQVYDNLKEGAGLLFPYKKPEDVVYHMGTVKFPIDIIFIDANDKIKKIYSDIQPGTLATFGCANVKNVLEICGGLSDRLGISVGNKISFDGNKNGIFTKISHINDFSKKIGSSKSIIIKYSTYGKNTFSTWRGFPILNVNSKIVKTAKRETLLSDFILSIPKPTSKDLHIFDFDGLIQNSPNLRVYKTSSDTSVSDPYIKLDGTTVAIIKNASGTEITKDIHVKDILTKKFAGEVSILSSLTKSYKDFMKNANNDSFQMFSELRKISHSKNDKAILVTRLPNHNYLKEIISGNYRLYFGEEPKYEVVKIAEDSSANDIVEITRRLYGNQNIKIYSDESFLKRAGLPVSEEIKNYAKDSYKKLDQAGTLAKESIKGLKKNVDEYNKLNATPDKIPGTKGLYHQSCKNNKELFLKILDYVKDAVKILNEIKDSSKTPVIIDSLKASSQAGSSAIQDILNLAEQIESPEFITQLTDKTTAYEKVNKDLYESIDAAMKHITDDILGLIVMSTK